MKRLNLTLAMVLLGTPVAFAAELISEQTAEKEALSAVDGGTVLEATLNSYAGNKVWSVDIASSINEHEVRVDAHTGAILKIITQPASSKGLISKEQAEEDALAAVGGGHVLQAKLDTEGKNDRKVWTVDVLGSTQEHEVWVDAHFGAILKIITQPLESMGCTFITRATAVKIALTAVGGGRVVLAVLEKSDTPADWSVDLVSSRGTEYEVKVNACTGKVIARIVGG
jgi:uncharacterized membrane protein YkoI